LILEHGGVRIGLMGLIEEEWLSTLAQIEPAQVAYTDYVAVARELEPWLRREARCELVIALTHSREPNDHRLALECPGLDLILGGHDHDSHRKVRGWALWTAARGCPRRELALAVCVCVCVCVSVCVPVWVRLSRALPLAAPRFRLETIPADDAAPPPPLLHPALR
jgi:hypothetical protein